MQNFTALQAELVSLGDIDDVQALQNILDYALSLAEGDLDQALIYAASSFYRRELGRFGGATDYSYTHLTPQRFGVSGFSNKFVGEPSNTNQLQHFIGEAHLMVRAGGTQIAGNFLAWFQDPGNTRQSVADRELGYIAAWWISQPTSVSTAELVSILRNGN